MKTISRFTLSMLPAAILAASSFGLTYSRSAVATITANGEIKFNQTYTGNSPNFIGSIAQPVPGSFGLTSGLGLYGYSFFSAGEAVSSFGQAGSGSTSVSDTVRFQVSKDGTYNLLIQSYSIGGPGNSAEATLWDESTGQKLIESRTDTPGTGFITTKIRLKAASIYSIVGRATSFVDSVSTQDGRGSFGATLVPVPEPGSIALLAGAALAGLRRRRNH